MVNVKKIVVFLSVVFFLTMITGTAVMTAFNSLDLYRLNKKVSMLLIIEQYRMEKEAKETFTVNGNSYTIDG